MHWADPASLNLTLLCTSLAAAMLAGSLLALEFFSSPVLARRAPGVFSATLAVGALAAWFVGWRWFSLGAGSLATILIVAWPMSFDRARTFIAKLATPKVAWAAVLLLSMIASRYLAAHVLGALDRQPLAQAVDLEDLPVRLTAAFTDQGRAIPLFHFKIHSTDVEVQQFIDSHEKERSQIIRLIEPNPAANCHGWVFTGGQYGIRDPDVAAILSDNGYVEVAEPREGDLAIYSSDRITHSGVVRIVDKHAAPLVESKWGPLGVYLHAIDKQPFGGTCRIYRSGRADHLIALERASSAEPASQSLTPLTGAQ
jgi:hypothetical protein